MYKQIKYQGESSDTDDDIKTHSKLIRHYENKLKQGIVLDQRRIIKYTNKNTLPRPSKKFMKKLPKLYESTAIKSRHVSPVAYQGALIERFGTVFIDLAIFYKDKRFV